jgi:hypothetical protein
MYTRTNYASKKALKEDLAAGKKIAVFQPGGMFESQTDGNVSLEGPHYPKPHKWYAQAVIKDGYIVSVK